MGIVAKKYSKFSKEEAYAIFHSSQIRFGNGYRTILEEDSKIYEDYFPMPLEIVKEKNDKNEQYKLHSRINYKISKGQQFKQQKVGYLSCQGNYLADVEKTFALKSAYNDATRRSKEGSMFGFESIECNQLFIFSVWAEDKELLDEITKLLNGEHHLGKSKTAEYGNVSIQPIDVKVKPISFSSTSHVLVYAASNVCMLDDLGMPTLQPSASQLGFQNGEIDWSKSSVKSVTYTPWNGVRNTPSLQRDCIAKGSVFYIVNSGFDCSSNNEVFIGEYQAEGLGRCIYNPLFLEHVPNEDIMKMQIIAIKKNKPIVKKVNDKYPITQLGLNLLGREKEKTALIIIGKKINDVICSKHPFTSITNSQWGRVRSIAQNSNDVVSVLEDKLKEGYAAEKYWYKDGVLDKFLKLIADEEITNKKLFTIKLCAEMAKSNDKKLKTNNNDA